ncbi:class I SAM-dependent methyltransferase [Pedobacter yulinensis]|uniref:Class I SAM-dependent methyltransferase n=1 Tax=Pedobacter yulinensis TaxID=2126353 RepID=A0A2T3HJ02_9SPHI|nr:class I SAM-dependent methyltransferase [Pedobacter yulinensis]PST82383.1 class I SAM-dependent methyltransferase [Pedobacter yulinensis]
MNNLSAELDSQREVARQLRCPEGEGGIRTATGMEHNNANMIRKTLDGLEPASGSDVLELGFGNAAHLNYLFSKYRNLRYTGADISETMLVEARNIAAVSDWAPRTRFLLTDGKTLPFDNATFDGAFSVNTIYFWEDPLAYAGEISRVLKPGGCVCLGFCSAQFMEKLPFTQFGFTLYEPEQIARLMMAVGFGGVSNTHFEETITAPNGVTVERDFYVMKFTALLG